MKVSNELVYHFHKSNEYDPIWKPGTEINFTNDKKNSFLSFYDDHAPFYPIDRVNHSPIIAAKEMKRLLQYWGAQDFAQYLDFSLNVFRECGMYIREQIFEEIRRTINTDLPSRHSCLWVFREYSKKYWRESLGPNIKLFELRITGEMFIADQEYLYDEIVEHNEIRQNAKKYWKGASGKDPEHEECLFIGKAEICNLIE